MQVISKVACSGLAALLLTGSVSVAQPAYALTRAEQEQEVLKQQEKLEFALKLQENARKAALLAREQQLENSVNQMETAIQRKLIEEQANQQAAEAKGLSDRAARIEIETEQIKDQEASLKAAAAKAEAQLGQATLVEKAREVEEQQAVDQATSSILDLLGLKESDFGF
eukprot:gene5435-5668_t